ncbi:hypothetical protein DFJ58DRAFT_720123 [Suillus subalutaceus]|uniref:uncharacterized protein n=1 Tax=Suillus subalutaceus TaxID=48586 RepID=UPI001B868AE3|nr:uncharacterized protein DFJ58DRAFT_720123 [Suillus subalutaceus]KAG1822153.1 hypothetical protein DFJ58DRAFT_720123 [Suillus subalutaceus]
MKQGLDQICGPDDGYVHQIWIGSEIRIFGSVPGNMPPYELDDIKVKYHPHSKQPSTIHHFSEFSCSHPPEGQVPYNNSPWEPFWMRLDYEVAEIALTKEQTNCLLDLVHQSASVGTDTFTLQSHNEVRSLWEMASQHYTLFQKDVVSFEMHYRPLWDWALDLLQDICLACHFVFDAQCLSKFNGEKCVRFIDEPWTADAFWNAQCSLNFCWMQSHSHSFYMLTKTKLSSFGTAKGYPIIAHIANLPIHIRNGNTALGGGRVVGWLLIVTEDQKHTRKKSFVDFKNVVWHKSFYQILWSIELHSKTSYWFECRDQIQHCLWPLILILSGDYEEQCVMALIRGLKGKFPCPVCLNVFWNIFLADVHLALSVDRLHMNHEGLWEDHLWKDILFWISDIGQEAAVKLDANFDALPQWPNLTHFKAIVSVNFNNGSFYKNISKLILFTAQDILCYLQSKLGYLLLHCVRYYIELNIYALLEVHTEETIAAGRATLDKFSELMDDVAPQILHYDHWLLTSTSMRTELDEHVRMTTTDPETNKPLPVCLEPDPVTHVHLGSKQDQHSFSDITCTHGSDRAFTDFRKKLNGFLNVFLPQNGIPLPDGPGRVLHLQAEDQITEFRFLRVNYESMVDWRMRQDLLWCSPSFYGSPRFDCVIVKTAGKPFIAHLVYLFGCSIGDADLHLAIIHPYDVGIGVRRRWDVDLGLWCVRAKPCSSSEIISVQSII